MNKIRRPQDASDNTNPALKQADNQDVYYQNYLGDS